MGNHVFVLAGTVGRLPEVPQATVGVDVDEETEQEEGRA
jgi:hypothetical protein